MLIGGSSFLYMCTLRWQKCSIFGGNSVQFFDGNLHPCWIKGITSPSLRCLHNDKTGLLVVTPVTGHGVYQQVSAMHLIRRANGGPDFRVVLYEKFHF